MKLSDVKVWFAPIDCKDENYQAIKIYAWDTFYANTPTEELERFQEEEFRPIVDEYLREVATLQKTIVRKYRLKLEYSIGEMADTYD